MSSRYRLLDLTIDLVRQRVERGGERLEIAGLSFQLLACLIERGDRVVGFDELMNVVWAPAVVNEETVTQRVRLLRQALGDDARQPRYIRTVRGGGYRLAAPAQPIVERPRREKPFAAIAAAAVLVLVATGAFVLAHAPARVAPSAVQDLVDSAGRYAAMGQRDNNERALELYDKALSIAPDDVAALTGASRARSARVCLYNGTAGNAQRAFELARRATSLRPDRAATWSALGYARDCLGDLPGAIAGYENAMRLDPDDEATSASAAYLYQETGRLADALKIETRVRKCPRCVPFLAVQVARAYDLLGFTTQAEARFRTAFELGPDNTFANTNWPAFLFAHGRFAEAQAALDEAEARKISRAELAQLRGELALQRGDRQAATDAFAHGWVMRRDSSLPQTLAIVYGAAPPDQAWLATRIRELRVALADDAWPQSHLELAILLQAAGDRHGAVAALSAAVDAGYRDAAYLRISPLFAATREDPAFDGVLAAIGRRVAVERDRVWNASWRPDDLSVSSAAL